VLCSFIRLSNITTMTKIEKLFEILCELPEIRKEIEELLESGLPMSCIRGIIYPKLNIQHLLRTAEKRGKNIAINMDGCIMPNGYYEFGRGYFTDGKAVYYDLLKSFSDQSPETLEKLAEVII